MKIKLLITSILSLFLVISCEKESVFDQGLTTEDPGLKSTKIQETSFEGSVVSIQLYSPSLEGNLLGDPALRNVNVYLPKSYFSCPERSFPVIYYLHGIPASENSLMDPVPYDVLLQMANLQAPVDFPEEGFTAWVNNLIDCEGMKEAIIIMSNAANRYTISLYSNSNVQGNYEDYIVDDLVPFIDSHFRTISHFNFRAIVGHSAGGYGALRLAMKYPHVFHYVAGLSPGHFTDEFFLTCAPYMLLEEQIWGGFPGPTPYTPSAPYKFVTNTVYSVAAAFLPNPENPPYYVDLPFSYDESGQPALSDQLMAKVNEQSLFALAMNNKTGLKQLKTIYIDAGIYDDLGLYLPNQAFHEFLSEMKIKHQYETFEGTHFSHLYYQLGKALVMLSNEFPEKD